MLAREQIEHYRGEGYVVVERLLDADTLAELRPRVLPSGVGFARPPRHARQIGNPRR